MIRNIRARQPLNGALASLAAVLGLFAGSTSALAWPAEATRELAVREGPGMHHPHIEVIAPGTVVDIRHCNVDRTWCKVNVDGTVGYVRGAYLERVGDVYVGPRVELYTTYSTRRIYGPPPRPYMRPHHGPHHLPPHVPPPPLPHYRW